MAARMPALGLPVTQMRRRPNEPDPVADALRQSFPDSGQKLGSLAGDAAMKYFSGDGMRAAAQEVGPSGAQALAGSMTGVGDVGSAASQAFNSFASGAPDMAARLAVDGGNAGAMAAKAGTEAAGQAATASLMPALSAVLGPLAAVGGPIAGRLGGNYLGGMFGGSEPAPPPMLAPPTVQPMRRGGIGG